MSSLYIHYTGYVEHTRTHTHIHTHTHTLKETGGGGDKEIENTRSLITIRTILFPGTMLPGHGATVTMNTETETNVPPWREELVL